MIIYTHVVNPLQFHGWVTGASHRISFPTRLRGPLSLSLYRGASY